MERRRLRRRRGPFEEARRGFAVGNVLRPWHSSYRDLVDAPLVPYREDYFGRRAGSGGLPLRVTPTGSGCVTLMHTPTILGPIFRLSHFSLNL